MKLGPIKINDRSGREITLRNAETDDAEALIEYLKTTSVETRFLIRELDEISLTIEAEQRFIEEKIKNTRSLMLTAFYGKELVGCCSFVPVSALKRYSHRCSVAIALFYKYCGCGIGSQMMKVLLEAAKSTGFEQAELEVITENKNAIQMYTELGFERYGTVPNCMKYSDGTYGNADRLIKFL